MKILTHNKATRQIEKLHKQGITAIMKQKLNGYIVIEQPKNNDDPMFI